MELKMITSDYFWLNVFDILHWMELKLMQFMKSDGKEELDAQFLNHVMSGANSDEQFFSFCD